MNGVKGLIPAAGFGTRFLPASKSVPKEMLPLVEKPAIHYIIDEGTKSGIKDFVIVTGKNKRAIEDYFDSYTELENVLNANNKSELLDSISKLIKNTNFLYVKQHEQLGLGHAVWTARKAFSKEEHVAIFLPDDIITGPVPGMSQLMKIAVQERCSVVAVQEVPQNEVSRYGIINVKKQFSPNLFQVKELIEKPLPHQAPSNLAIIGRYVLSPEIFESLESVRPGAIGEIQLTDGIQNMLLSGEKVFAYKIQGQRYDTGTIMGWLKTNIDLALKHPKYSQEILEYIVNLEKEMVVLQGKADALIKTRTLNF